MIFWEFWDSVGLRIISSDYAYMNRQIDYDSTQLSDTELAEHLDRVKQQELAEANAERQRWSRAKEFHFIGGML